MPKNKFSARDLAEKIAAFDRLPDDAIVDDRVAGALLNMSMASVRRTNPVKRRQISERIFGRRVGDLREKIRR
jgi:hypothetical protein